MAKKPTLNTNHELRWDHLRQRSQMYQAIRRYFNDTGFLEVETPILAAVPIPESHIELFETQSLCAAKQHQRLFLLPSPEMWMKRLLADGAPSMYQISRCFRNGEQMDLWHRCEFTMLEWYEIGIGASKSMIRMQELFLKIHQVLNGCDSQAEDFVFMTMEDAFREFAGFSLEEDILCGGWSDSALPQQENQQTYPELRRIFSRRLEERGLCAGEDGDTADDLFHRLFIDLVEDSLPKDCPLILSRWPALIPTLARRIPHSPWAERWEMYYKGVEVANCYAEENDENRLKSFWLSEAEKKRWPDSLRDDKTWIEALRGKMPDCSGAAVGLDRLLALIRGDKSLEELDIFPAKALSQISDL